MRRKFVVGASQIDGIRKSTSIIEMDLMSSDPNFAPDRSKLIAEFKAMQEHISLLQKTIAQEYPE